MGGISTSIQPQSLSAFLPIFVSDREAYTIRWQTFEKTATDDELLKFTDQVLHIFWEIEKTVRRSNSLDIDPDLCQTYLVKLAKCGRIAYRKFFQTSQARELLTSNFQMMAKMGVELPAPTFVSKKVLFPWEVLYAGDTYHDGDPEHFWGLRYTPARILTPERDISQHVMEQAFPSDMLFCLHHRLRQAHTIEWPAIQRLIMVANKGHCSLLSPIKRLLAVQDGETLLAYLDQASHNMVHFACHCKPDGTDADTLLISLLKDDVNYDDAAPGDTQVIELGSITFLAANEGKFQRRPMVFLNACQSAGGADQLRKTLNLPQEFIRREAGAVIATACPVPDVFAAAFAQQFYSHFLSGQMTIGQALRATRWHFLEKHHNPLGLAYGLYSPAQYRLAQPPMIGGAA